MTSSSHALRAVARFLGEALVTLGGLLALFLVWQLWWTDVQANTEARQILEAAMAIVHLPSIGEVRPVEQGVALSVLNQGVLGHYPESAAPGEVGNFAVAGHRTTYGRPLWDIDALRAGDPIVVETATDYYVYRVQELRILDPYQVEVVAPVPGEPGATPSEGWMVMTACHPKFSADQRIVAMSRLEYGQPRSAGPPAELDGG